MFDTLIEESKEGEEEGMRVQRMSFFKTKKNWGENQQGRVFIVT